jgi:hypothetical protein
LNGARSDDGGGDAMACFPNIAAITLTSSAMMRCVASAANDDWKLDNALNKCMVRVEVSESLVGDFAYNWEYWWHNSV